MERCRRRCYRSSLLASATAATMIHVHRVLGTWAGKVAQYIALSGAARAKFIAGGFDPERIAVKPTSFSRTQVLERAAGVCPVRRKTLRGEGDWHDAQGLERLAPPLPLKLLATAPCDHRWRRRHGWCVTRNIWAGAARWKFGSLWVARSFWSFLRRGTRACR